jgi:protein-S-isoprenylcysteine O-methyltransferase Ste14
VLALCGVVAGVIAFIYFVRREEKKMAERLSGKGFL